MPSEYRTYDSHQPRAGDLFTTRRSSRQHGHADGEGTARRQSPSRRDGRRRRSAGARSACTSAEPPSRGCGQAAVETKHAVLVGGQTGTPSGLRCGWRARALSNEQLATVRSPASQPRTTDSLCQPIEPAVHDRLIWTRCGQPPKRSTAAPTPHQPCRNLFHTPDRRLLRLFATERLRPAIAHGPGPVGGPRRAIVPTVARSSCTIAGHPDTTAQARRLAAVLEAAGLSAKVVAGRETTHTSINDNIGRENDPVTTELFAFVAQAFKP